MTKIQLKTEVVKLNANKPITQVSPKRGRRMTEALMVVLVKGGGGGGERGGRGWKG